MYFILQPAFLFYLKVEDLNHKLQNISKGNSYVNGHPSAEDSERLRKYVDQLKEQTESERIKMTETLTRWADEVNETYITVMTSPIKLHFL